MVIYASINNSAVTRLKTAPLKKDTLEVRFVIQDEKGLKLD